MTRIDLHAHYVPGELADELAAVGGQPIAMRHAPQMDDRLAEMDAAGVDRQILSLGAFQPYWPETSAAVQAARLANSLYHEATRSPRFGAFGCVPLPHGQEAAGEAVRCLDELGFDGIGLSCSTLGVPLDDQRIDPLWTELDDRNAVVYLHPGWGLGVPAEAVTGMADYSTVLGPVFGVWVESAVAVVRLVLSGVTTRYPNVRFIVAAMGGALPLQWGRLLDTAEFATQFDSNPELGSLGDGLRGFHFDTSTLDDTAVFAARRAGLVERLVFGSDAPLSDMARAVASVQDSALLSSAEKVAILDQRAESLLSTRSTAVEDA